MDRVRWGIVGCGAVTESKSGPGFQKAKGSELVAVMRRDARLAASYAERHGVRRWYDTAEALVHDQEVDAIYVATPPGSHLAYALMACAAKKPAYVEKPMARSFDECMRMEYRMVHGIVAGHDFYEGVRAALIDRDQSPRWQPDRLADVSEAAVARHFEPLDGAELQLATRAEMQAVR